MKIPEWRRHRTRVPPKKTALPFAALRSWAIAPPLSIKPLDNAVKDEAHPEVHYQPEVNPKRLMTARQRQVWHQDEEVEQAAHDYGNQLLEKSSKHTLIGHPQRRI